MSTARISIIIPVLNEEQALPPTLAALQPLRSAGHEIIVVDGASSDRTVSLARAGADRVLVSDRGRARQMNMGARAAAGRILVFLHADTLLPPATVDLLAASLRDHAWGRFDVRLSGRQPILRLVERAVNWRSRLSGIATGDQAMFMRREAFWATGGFPEIELMEDIALSRLLRAAFGRPACVRAPVVTSSRRWERHGIVRTIVKMWTLRLAYWLGVSPQTLARRYGER